MSRELLKLGDTLVLEMLACEESLGALTLWLEFFGPNTLIFIAGGPKEVLDS